MFTAQTFILFFWALSSIPLPIRSVNLAIFLIVLFFLLRKPVANAFEERRVSIKRELSKAKFEKEAAEAKLRELEGRLSRLDQEIAELKAQAEKEAAAEYARIVKQTEEDAARLHTIAKREIEGAAKAAQIELKDYAATKAVELAEEMIRKEIKPADDARLIADFAQELEGVK